MDRKKGIGGTERGDIAHRFKPGPEHPRWNGGGTDRQKDIWRAEKVLGKPMPSNAVLHHHTKTELVICEDQAYHALIHARARLIKNGIDPHKRKCALCKEYDFPENMVHGKTSRSYRHQSCHNEYKRELRRRKNGSL